MLQFVELTAPSVITMYALHLVAWRESVYDPMGSGILIAPHLVLTARHVMDDYWDKFDGRTQVTGQQGAFSCMALQTLQDGSIISHGIHKAWTAPWSDLALLQLSSDALPDRPRLAVAMTMAPPPVGATVHAFGYHDCSFTSGADSIEIVRKASTSTGVVAEVHHEFRDTFSITWPCFRTNARFEGGMSGGPVFNEKNELCGLVCRSMKPPTPDGEHTSYVTLLWPLLGLTIDLPRAGRPTGRYPAFELARDQMIAARNWDRVSLTRDLNGEVTAMALDHD
jgi:S1-C subfamily serine protease